MTKIIICDDGVSRCKWCTSSPEYIDYHDNEWGYPVFDDIRLFEKICLEGFQSGLSWITILRKREGFRSAFAGFDFYKVANFNQDDVERLVLDANIVRHRGKIEATINNAKRAIEMQQMHTSLAKYFWSFEPKPNELAMPQTISVSEVSIKISKELKKLGWKFVGPTTVFAFMQAMGMINDHAEGCAMREKARLEREKQQIQPD